jgi:hypothetical protein
MPGTHTRSKKSAFYLACEQVAVEELAERLHETGQRIDWITRDWILDPIANSAAPMSMMAGTEGVSYYQMYRDYLENFEPFFCRRTYMLEWQEKQEFEQNYWVQRIIQHTTHSYFHHVVGKVKHNFFDNGNRQSKWLPVLKLIDHRGVNVELCCFDSVDDPKVKILTLHSGDNVEEGNAFATYKFLRELRRHLIDQCGFSYIWGNPLQVETDFPMATEWRTKHKASVMIKRRNFTITRLTDYFVKSGQFLIMPDIFKNSDKLIVYMVSADFQNRLEKCCPEWRPCLDYCQGVRRRV